MDKVIRDGKVAVLVSRGYGGGWSTWVPDEYRETYLFHPKLVQMVEEGLNDEITSEWLQQELDMGEWSYAGGVEGLYIKWVPVGTQFHIEEYDGFETLVTSLDINWITA